VIEMAISIRLGACICCTRSSKQVGAQLLKNDGFPNLEKQATPMPRFRTQPTVAELEDFESMPTAVDEFIICHDDRSAQ